MTISQKPTKTLRAHDVSLFHDYEDDYDVLCSQFWLLTDIWNTVLDPFENAFVFLAFRSVESGKWHEHAIGKHEAHLEICRLIEHYSRWEYDQYFCPNPFSKPRRTGKFALPTCFGWCDIDEGDPQKYKPSPSLVWETSPSRYQALWAWDKLHEPEKAERFSRALAYRHGGDRNGWTITKMLRLPGSINHKPQHDEPFVHAVACDWSKIRARPLALKQSQTKLTSRPLEVDVNPTKFNRAEVIKKFGKSLHPKARTLMRNRKAYEPDNSAQIFHMIAALHEAGANTDETGCVLWTSPYFVEKHGQNFGKLNEEIARVLGKLEADE